MAPKQIPSAVQSFREFAGVNTQGARQAIEKGQFAWLESVMPVGFADLKTLNQASASRATIPASRVIYYSKEYVIGSTAYFFHACTDGSAWQQLVASPYTLTQIAAAGTFSGNATQVAQWKAERVLIIDTNANGYRDWNGVTLTTLSGTTSAPDGGTLIATFAGKVWIVLATGDGRVIAYSAAGSYVDFGSDGGSTTITDETLTSSIQQFLVANNFLYFFGVDSINVIADVQVAAGVTTFSNTNLVANLGSSFPATLVPYYRSVWYMNKSGIFALYGATPRKASDDLDGIFPLIDFTKPVSGGSVTLYNQLCVVFCFTYMDPTAGARQLMALYFNNKWFLASQNIEMDRIVTSHGGLDTLFGTLNSDVYELFADATTSIDQTIVSRFWDYDDFISIKQSIHFGVEMSLPAGTGTLAVTVDTERFKQAPQAGFGGSFAFTWFNSSGTLFTWTNSLGASFTWLTSGYIFFQGGAEVQGRYLGFTITATDPQLVYEGMHMNYRKLPAAWGAA